MMPSFPMDALQNDHILEVFKKKTGHPESQKTLLKAIRIQGDFPKRKIWDHKLGNFVVFTFAKLGGISERLKR